MLELGVPNTLQVLNIQDLGAYLDGGPDGPILMPARYVPSDLQVGDEVEVLVYRDSEDRLVATTEQPLAYVGDIAWLKVKAITRVGAFLDWGLSKDLLLPFSEQLHQLEEGKYCLVKIYVDNSDRLAASMKLERYLQETSPYLKVGQAVTAIVADKTELGAKLVINNQYLGMLYTQDFSRPLRKGEKLTAYVKRIRPEDQKIDLMLSPPGQARLSGVAQQILDRLEDNGGVLMLSDKSSPEVIQRIFGVSKKAFKQALGNLYKEKRVRLEKDRTLLLK